MAKNQKEKPPKPAPTKIITKVNPEVVRLESVVALIKEHDGTGKGDLAWKLLWNFNDERRFEKYLRKLG